MAQPPISWNKLRAEIERDEGRRASAYRDSLGYLTIGIGRLIDGRAGGGLSDEEIDHLFANDIARVYGKINYRLWFKAANTDARQRAFINMYFQLGERIEGFKRSLEAAERQDWAECGRRMRQSLWYRQTPERAERVIRMLETGEG